MDEVRGLGVIPPVQPRLRVSSDGRLEVVLPGEPGFDALTDDGPDAAVLERAAQASAADGDGLAELDLPSQGGSDAS